MDPKEIESLRDEIMKFLQSLPGPETIKLKNLMDKLAEQMIETQGDGNDVLFCGSDGQTIIKAVHFPRSVLNEDGPVILPSADSKVILAAFSDEFVQSNLGRGSQRFPRSRGARAPMGAVLKFLGCQSKPSTC